MTAAASYSDAQEREWRMLLDSRPSLNRSVSTCHHQYRNKAWLVFEDSLRGVFYRLDPSISRLFEAVDGSLTLQQLLRRLSEQEIEAIQAHQLIETFQVLIDNHLIDDRSGNFVCSENGYDGLRAGQDSKSFTQFKSWFFRSVKNPFAVRVPVIRPDDWLARCYQRLFFLFRRPVVLLATLFMIWVVVQVPGQWIDLKQHFDTRFSDGGNLMSLLWLYPLLKLLHELAHGLAIKHGGGYVKEAGVSFLVFYPVPYVDASCSAGFSEKSQRLWVAGAGIWMELLLSAGAFVVFVQAEPGWTRDISFNVMLLAAGSTLLFNGNPLLRFDGYYLLSDAIEIPNLGLRANAYYSYLLRSYGLHLPNVSPPIHQSDERAWLLGYGISAYVYRLVLAFVIASYLVQQFLNVGIFLAGLLLTLSIVVPFTRWISETWRLKGGASGQALMLRIGLGLLVLLGPVLIPFPHSTLVDAVVLVSERSAIRAEVEGEIIGQYKKSGQAVALDDAIFQLRNQELYYRVERLKAQRLEIELRHSQALLSDLSQMAVYTERAVGLERELGEERSRIQGLTVRAPLSGTFVSQQLDNMQGRWVNQGDLLGYVRDAGPLTAVASVDAVGMNQIRDHLDGAEVRLEDGRILPVSYVKLTPQASRQLPNALLGSAAGGEIATDQRDESGRRTPVGRFDVEIQVAEEQVDKSVVVGSRMMILFHHGNRNLFQRGWSFLERYWLENIKI